VGYHNEHHDFPNIPWTRLPELRRIAAEFYDPLVQTESWFGTSMKFLFDPNVGLYSRTRRERGAAARKDLMKTDVEPNPYLNKLLDDCKKRE
jgi:sphingolipid delta-4 desaturase